MVALYSARNHIHYRLLRTIKLENPKTFISYSWSSVEHETRILKLAEDLVSSGVEVILDKWHLREGHDAHVFMEKMVNDPEIQKVIIACDKAYQSKANSRSGGVGTEAQIISPELYSNQEQNKFVAVVFEKDDQGRACTPIYFSSRIYIDFTNPEEEAIQFERLVRWIYGKPIHMPPSLGNAPSYITDDETAIKIPTSIAYKRAIDAIKTNKPYLNAAITDYFDELINGLDQFRPNTQSEPYDEEVVHFIDAFIPYRNEAIAIFEALARYAPDSTYIEAIHKFLEDFHVYTHRDEKTSQYRDWDWDVFKFLHHEIFLYVVAILIKRKKFEEASQLINGGYYIKKAHEAPKLYDVSIFRAYLGSLEHRKTRLGLNRISLHADLLKERCSGISISFEDIMQADFVLYVARNIHVEDSQWNPWNPITLVWASYHATGFEVFIRGETAIGMKNVQTLLGIDNKEPITKLLSRIQKQEVREPKIDSFRPLSTQQLLNYEKLGTRS